MVAIIDMPYFLTHFDISDFNQFYDLEFHMGPSMVENKLEEFAFEESANNVGFNTLKSLGAYDIGIDYGSNSVIVRREERDAYEEESTLSLF